MMGLGVKRGKAMTAWRIMAGAACVMALGASGSGQAQTSAQAQSQTRAPEVIYAKICGYCHATRVGPVLFGRQLPTEYVTATARAGRNAMPAFRQAEISNAELDSLARWIKQSKTPVDGATKGRAR